MDMEKVTTEQQLSRWAQLIQTWLENGQSIKEFCRTNGVSKATYYYWQKKVSEAKCTVVEAVKESKTELPSGWMQLASKPVYPAKATLEIKINGCNVTVNTETDLELLKKVCQVLMSL
ncbi:IS66 family insertion sequence element accessory protein TnpA [Acetivibrio clariflavus]|uniref:Transposase n=1 Tax=Acetivibrio clariflavus (strain DSM 19732 / NBRC 101661 / EBR45) TaxID=720554 RepID=G8LW73_ACECE|nr:transposase [Acetivibrio clariflavus]AEV69720.1 Transposase [Acetivibrio clariflavus DSM 19732]